MDYSDYTIPDFAALAPRISGSISAVSSSTIIFLIFRSRAGMTTIYHRLMFGMSFADIMSSTAMALTTLPMPGNDDPIWLLNAYGTSSEIWWFDQTKIGNVHTCQAQGFFYSTGITVMFGYNGMLCLYYACAIAFKMQERDIRKKVEPFMHGVPLFLAIAYAIPAFIYHIYIPINNEPWCTVQPPPVLQKLSVIAICGLLGLILTSLGLVIWRVRKNGKSLMKATVQDNVNIEERVKVAHRNSKLIIAQSLAYIGAILLTLVSPLVRSVMYSTLDAVKKPYFSDKADANYILMGKVMFVILPLQGFFNLIIFLWHKVVSYRGVYSDASIVKAIRHQFSASAEVPVLFSRISILAQNPDDGELEVEVIDESSDSPPGDELSRAVDYDDLEEHGAEASVVVVSPKVPMQFYPATVKNRLSLRETMPVVSLSGLSFDPSLGSSPPINGPPSINSRSGMASMGPSLGTTSTIQPSSNSRQARTGNVVYDIFGEDLSMSSAPGRSQEASTSRSVFSSSIFSFGRSKGDESIL